MTNPNQNPSQQNPSQGQFDPKKGQQGQSGQYDPKKGQQGRNDNDEYGQKNREQKQSGNY